MKSALLACLFSILFLPHFSYAENIKDHAIHYRMHGVHHAHRRHSRSKSNDRQPVNINQADLSELSTLKGIGPKKAEAIIAYRTSHGPFTSVSGLAKVKGIGLKSVARLQAKNPGRLVVNTAVKMG
jgi:comEA protein